MNGSSASRSEAAASFIAVSRSSKPPLSTATQGPFPPTARTSPLTLPNARRHVALDGRDARVVRILDRVELEQLGGIVAADDVVGDARRHRRRELLVLERGHELRPQCQKIERSWPPGLCV